MKVKLIVIIIVLLCLSTKCLSYNIYFGKLSSSRLPDYYYNGLKQYSDSQPDLNYTMGQMIPGNLPMYNLYITYYAGLGSQGFYEYSSGEIIALRNYMKAGGRVLFFSDHTGTGGSGINIDPYLNTLLPQLGSQMSLNGGVLDGGGHHDSISGQILSNPFTGNVDLIKYAAVNTISGGTPLLLASNLSTSFFSYEQINKGYLFLSGDFNLMDLAYDPSYDNGRFFRNLIVVPEPTVLSLLALGGLALLRKRR